MKKTLTLSACALLLSFSFNSFANTGAAKWYQIELVVFSHITKTGANSQNWPAVNPEEQDLTSAISLSQNPNTPAFNLLPKRKFVLSDEASKIANQEGYNILLHVAWKQPVLSPRNAQAIHIYGGNVYSPNGHLLASNITDGNTAYNTQGLWELNGTVKISVVRYLDAQFNLLLAEPTNQLAQVASDGYFDRSRESITYFRINQNRRMRSRELNYIDNPLFGALIKIVPVKNPNPPKPQAKQAKAEFLKY